MTISLDKLIEALPAKRRAKVRQRVLALLMEAQQGTPSREGVVDLKEHRKKKKNGIVQLRS